MLFIQEANSICNKKMEEVVKSLLRFLCVTASGSGSVIGRDPLPPRAVSTSQLPQQKTMLIKQPPAIVSTLPLSRTANAQHRQHQAFNPLQHSPSSTGNLYTNHEQLDSRIMKTSNLGDVKATMGWVYLSLLLLLSYSSLLHVICNQTKSSAHSLSTLRRQVLESFFYTLYATLLLKKRGKKLCDFTF